MYKEILRSIAGIDVFPIVSLCLFVAVFVVMLVRTMRTDKASLAAYANLPLDRPGTAGSAGRTAEVERISDRGATL